LAVKEVGFHEGGYEGDSKSPLREPLGKKVVPMLKTTHTVRATAIRLIPSVLKALKKRRQQAFERHSARAKDQIESGEEISKGYEASVNARPIRQKPYQIYFSNSPKASLRIDN
jgi:hypothetical protein